MSRQPCTGAKKNCANTAKSSDGGFYSSASGEANNVETEDINGSEGEPYFSKAFELSLY